MVFSAAVQPQIHQPQLAQNTPKNVDSLSLENLVDPASSSDVSTFHQTIQNVIEQNPMLTQGLDASTADMNGIISGLFNSLNTIQSQRRKYNSMIHNADELSSSAGKMVEFQETLDNMVNTLSIFSKLVGLSIKSIDTLVHMQ